MLNLITRDRFGFFLPESEEQIIAIIALARKTNRRLRVMGSLHSIPESVLNLADSREVHLSLDFFNRMEICDVQERLIRVQAGCRLDFDPYSLSGNSSHTHGLTGFLDSVGWALPDLGGITHQSIAGYLATGSAGGTLRHSLYECIKRVRFVDGKGIIHELTEEDPLFHGALVSLGLWGIITELTIKCIARYDVIGKESVFRISESPMKFKMTKSDDRPAVSAFLQSKEYARMMWWPQQNVEKLVVWEASRMTPLDRERLQHFGRNQIKEKRYRQMGTLPKIATYIAGKYLTLSGNAIFNLRAAKFLQSRRESLIHLLNLFIVADSEKKGNSKGIPQFFNDSWHHGLPMDYEMDDEIFPTKFTELWVPVRLADAAMADLSKHFESGGASATGSYCCEIYAAKATNDWLSPSYRTDAVRFDFFWFEKINADPNQVFFPQFWSLLKKYSFRPHWGKYLPPRTHEWRSYLQGRYPKWKAFQAARRKFDPDNIFLSDYWAFYFS